MASVAVAMLFEPLFLRFATLFDLGASALRQTRDADRENHLWLIAGSIVTSFAA